MFFIIKSLFILSEKQVKEYYICFLLIAIIFCNHQSILGGGEGGSIVFFFSLSRDLCKTPKVA